MTYHPEVIRLLERVELAGRLWSEASTVERLGLQDALTVCLAESPPLLERGPVAGAIGADRPPSFRLTKQGRAVLALRRMGGSPSEAEINQQTGGTGEQLAEATDPPGQRAV